MSTDSRAPRITVDQPVALYSPWQDQMLAGRIKNISEGGVFISELNPLPEEHTRFQFCFTLPNGHGIEGEGIVMRSISSTNNEEPPGVAIHYDSFRPGCASHLKSFIQGQLETSAEDKVKLKLEESNVVFSAWMRSSSKERVVAECELPFLKIGSSLQFQQKGIEPVKRGTLSWVSVHVPPDTKFPRITLGVDLADQQAASSAPIVISSTQANRRKDPTTVLITGVHEIPQKKRSVTPLFLVGGAIIAFVLLWLFFQKPVASVSPSNASIYQSVNVNPVKKKAQEKRQGVDNKQAQRKRQKVNKGQAQKSDPMQHMVRETSSVSSSFSALRYFPTRSSFTKSTSTKSTTLQQSNQRQLRKRRLSKRAKKLLARKRRLRSRLIAARLAKARHAMKHNRPQEARRLALEVLHLHPGNRQASAILLKLWRHKGTRPLTTSSAL